jgi:chromosomal replication initiator protein
VSTPNTFVKEWLEQKYQKQILKILREIDETIRNIVFQIRKDSPKALKSSPAASLPPVGQLGFEELSLNKDTNLNPKYTFNNYIVGPFNELAHAASWAVAQKPGLTYNPLFIYGGVGLGKTHLMQAIGNEIIGSFPEKRVRYIPSEKLTSEIVWAIRNGGMESLKAKYHNSDAFIIDDVQFLSGREKTQDEFFHIFNSLYNKNKQIILSSDRPPKAILELSDRLRSRFEGGMIADISGPDFETRLAILKTKSQAMNINFSEEVFSFIATKIQSNIRELEGALTKLAAHARLQNINPTVDVCQALLFAVPPRKLLNFKKIVQGTADFYDIKEKDIFSASRKKEIVRPRQVIMYLLREELKASFPFIGRKLGNKDHTTVIHAYKKISAEIKFSEDMQTEINTLKQRIHSL